MTNPRVKTPAGSIDASELPDRFTVGAPGTSKLFHTGPCWRVRAAISNNTKQVKDGDLPCNEVSENTIEVMDLDECPHCEVVQ